MTRTATRTRRFRAGSAPLYAASRRPKSRKPRDYWAFDGFGRGIQIGALIDPACGSGNFLTEAYRQLRTIENRIIKDEVGYQAAISLYRDNPIRVSPTQFYGIEINDFAVSVAKTALWITEEQMLRKTQEILPDYDFEFLPLKALPNIHEANALTTDWAKIFPDKLTYLVGNPPFLGARNQSAAQKEQVMAVFEGEKNAGNIDFCAAWYMKAAQFTKDKHTRCALVSTNSICQGEQVANIWAPLTREGIHIDFAHNTFRWDNEAADKAHVFCVIVGFSREESTKELFIHDTPDSPERKVYPKQINAYLKDAPIVFVWSRSHPLYDVPEIGIGSQPIDDGNYLFTEEEKDDFLKREPSAEKFFHPWLGSREFINGAPRYCLWLGAATWKDLKDLPLCHFGVLSSQIHNAWMRTVAGRLKSDYRYSGGVVYNNFVWPNSTNEQRAAIERCAQNVLDARDFYEGATLADLYDPKNEALFPELMKAHKNLDAAVEAAYGVSFNGDEEKIVAHLFKLYAEKTTGDK